MAFFLAVANRKGGVGKSTLSVGLAHAFAVWSAKKVLLIDLDAQSNSSLILLGGEQWIDAQRTSKNVAAYVEDRMYAINPIKDYIVTDVGDVACPKGRLALLPGSLRFEDMQDELISFHSRGEVPFHQAKLRCAAQFRRALEFAGPLADIVILDCAPGLSNATAAALALATRVLVPFRPDAVSEFAVDRISTIIQGKSFEAVEAIEFDKRRYVCVANSVRPGGRDAIYVDTIAGKHPTLATQIPFHPDLAAGFDWSGERQTMEEKYADALPPLRALHSELTALLGL
jgi:cellulose biosynthesis protein BcsQ